MINLQYGEMMSRRAWRQGEEVAFSRFVDEWFSGRFDGPTEIQKRAWEVIERGENALIIAPTGSARRWPLSSLL